MVDPHFASYHANKEREAYVTATLFLSASVAYLARAGSLSQHQGLLLLGLTGATVLGVLLVAFQLYYRWIAARMVGACTIVASQWLAVPPTPAEYRPLRVGGFAAPDAVVQQFRRQRVTQAVLAFILIPGLLLLWGGLVILCDLAPGGHPMHLVPWLNGVGLAIGVVAAFLLAFYPLTGASLVTEKGERVLQFVNQPSPETLKQAARERCLARLGAWLLVVAFLLQLVALVLPRLCPQWA